MNFQNTESADCRFVIGHHNRSLSIDDNLSRRQLAVRFFFCFFFLTRCHDDAPAFEHPPRSAAMLPAARRPRRAAAEKSWLAPACRTRKRRAKRFHPAGTQRPSRQPRGRLISDRSPPTLATSAFSSRVAESVRSASADRRFPDARRARVRWWPRRRVFAATSPPASVKTSASAPVSAWKALSFARRSATAALKMRCYADGAAAPLQN